MLSLRGKKRVSLRGGTGGGGGVGGIGQSLEVWVGVKGVPLRPSKACPCLRQESHFATLFKKKDDVNRISKCFVLRPT